MQCNDAFCFILQDLKYTKALECSTFLLIAIAINTNEKEFSSNQRFKKNIYIMKKIVEIKKGHGGRGVAKSG